MERRWNLQDRGSGEWILRMAREHAYVTSDRLQNNKLDGKLAGIASRVLL